MKKTAIIFPGQGSQFVGMGKEFIENEVDASTLMAKASAKSGLDLRSLCLEGPMEELTRSLHIQPCVTIINMICWQQFKKMLPDFSPAFLAGHSLGECCALYAAGVISAEDTISLVANRGAFMDREGNANPGGMRAVLGLNINQVNDILAGFTGPGRVVVANHNTAEQIVISGDMAGLDIVGALCREKGGKVIPLKVSVANHSPLVAGAVADYQNFLKTLTFAKPEIPIIFNFNAEAETNPDKIPAHISSQLASTVLWYDTINKMLAEGVELFVELGPKTVLTGLVKKIARGNGTAQFMQADTLQAMGKVVSAIKQ